VDDLTALPGYPSAQLCEAVQSCKGAICVADHRQVFAQDAVGSVVNGLVAATGLLNKRRQNQIRVGLKTGIDRLSNRFVEPLGSQRLPATSLKMIAVNDSLIRIEIADCPTPAASSCALWTIPNQQPVMTEVYRCFMCL
jgi:hypothetical protein